MALETVSLPSLGESVLEGVVGRWLVRVGERVEVDQPLVEITTDKVDSEIPSPTAGVVVELLAAEDEAVEVGGGLLRIDLEGTASVDASPVPAPESEPATPPVSPAPSRASEPSPKATPVARKLASEKNLDLSAVEGSGSAGRILKKDVVAAGAPTPPASAAGSQGAGKISRGTHPPEMEVPPRFAYVPEPEDRVIPMSPLRRIVAEHMVQSKRISPHVGTVAEVDFGGVADFRDAHKAEFKRRHGFALTFLPFVLHVTARALREFPELNASVVENAIAQRQAINLGIAVETEKGLMVPVIANADRYSLTGIAEAVHDLSSRARSKRLSPDEIRGGSFTVSNPGRKGNLYGFAVINQPQVGILRLGELVKRPVVRSLQGQDAVVIRPMMHMALSYDHRAVDGSPANAFLYRIRELLEAAEFDL